MRGISEFDRIRVDKKCCQANCQANLGGAPLFFDKKEDILTVDSIVNILYNIRIRNKDLLVFVLRKNNKNNFDKWFYPKYCQIDNAGSTLDFRRKLFGNCQNEGTPYNFEHFLTVFYFSSTVKTLRAVYIRSKLRVNLLVEFHIPSYEQEVRYRVVAVPLRLIFCSLGVGGFK